MKLAVELRPEHADPAALLDPRHHVHLAELAALAGVDLVALPDSFAFPRDARPSLDAVAIAARVAPAVPGLALVPTVTVTHTEPFHLAKAIATLDFVMLGRAGVQVDVSRTAQEAELFGRRPAAPAAELWAEADEACEVIVRLWDSWEDDAVIRDAPTGRYIDRAKLHYIDFTGRFFSVKGPSITPRSPQAHPLVAVRADEPEALPVLARWADVARIGAPDLATARRMRQAARDAVAAAGRDPDAVAVLLDVELTDAAPFADLAAAAAAAGAADGVTAVPLRLPDGLHALVEAAARLADRGLRAPADPDATLRARFGLPRAANHFAEPSR